MPELLINGVIQHDAAHAIAANDRGLAYGDGLFETTLVQSGEVRFIDAHLDRLLAGCERLHLRAPPRQLLLEEISQMARSANDAVLKVIVTRGAGGRGYRSEPDLAPTRIIATLPRPTTDREPIAVRWCQLRLGRNASLAGLKHLNRLEQVLAQQEWTDPHIAEGLMLDTEGELVCGTACNVFVVREGALSTPDLRYCGVAGVMRRKVLEAAARLGIAASEEPLWPHDLEQADEVFVTNAVRGIRSVAALDSFAWASRVTADRLAATLKL